MLEIKEIPALGTKWWFSIQDSVSDDIKTQVQKTLEQELQQFDNQYSRFKPTSHLSNLNSNRQLLNPSPEFLQLLSVGINFYKKTNGFFNPCLGHILENRGYGQATSISIDKSVESEEFVPSPLELINFQDNSVILEGLGNLDFGGFGKGFLIDKLGHILAQKFNIQNFRINGGGDILVKTVANQMVNSSLLLKNETSKLSTLFLENPFTGGEIIGQIKLNNGSLASSSNFKRQWKNLKTNQTFGHLINPNELNNFSKISSFVIAENAVLADVLTSVMCIVERDIEKIAWLRAQFKFEYLQVLPSLQTFQSKGFPKIL